MSDRAPDGFHEIPVQMPYPDDETGEQMRRGCPHLDFTADVVVNRVENVSRFVADVSITCSHCGVRFAFVGAPLGILFDRPCVGLDPTTLMAPIVPSARPSPA